MDSNQLVSLSTRVRRQFIGTEKELLQVQSLSLPIREDTLKRISSSPTFIHTSILKRTEQLAEEKTSNMKLLLGSITTELQSFQRYFKSEDLIRSSRFIVWRK